MEEPVAVGDEVVVPEAAEVELMEEPVVVDAVVVGDDVVVPETAEVAPVLEAEVLEAPTSIPKYANHEY